MRFKPRLFLEIMLLKVNKHTYGREGRSILEKQLSNLNSANIIQINISSENENLEESRELYLKYIDSQNKLTIMKMNQEKTLNNIIKNLNQMK